MSNEAITMITRERDTRERQRERALVLSNEAITMVTREREILERETESERDRESFGFEQ